MRASRRVAAALAAAMGVLAWAGGAGAAPGPAAAATTADDHVQAAVVNGTPAPEGRWPSTVALVVPGLSPADGQFCTGTVIGDRWVLTAAHCADAVAGVGADVVGGTQRLDAPAGSYVRVGVEQFVVHPGWTPATFLHDLALARTATPLGLPAARLAGPGALADVMGEVAGYGCAQWAGSECAALPLDLMEAPAPVAGDSACAAFFGQVGATFHAGTELCAGWLSEVGAAPAVCSGDSGGPLVVPSETGVVLAGVTSRGGIPCGYVPSIFTEVSAYADWIAATIAAAPTPPASPPTPVGDGRFVPLAPNRLLDTRTGTGYAGVAPVAAGGIVELQVTGRAGIPADATAVVVNLTATEAAGPGFVQALPTGSGGIGTASNLNLERVGQTIPNLAVVPVGAGGRISLYTQSGGHLLADVFGYFAPTGGEAVRAGRLVPGAPQRVLDTRTTSGPVPSGGTVRVALPGVPLDATAAVLNVTATEAAGPGYVQALPAGSPWQGAWSNLNVEAGQTIANLVIVPVVDGAVDLHAQTATHLVADLLGHFTGESAPEATAGLFTAVPPARLLDTRLGPRPEPATAVTVHPAGAAGVPATGVAAVFANVTATDAAAPGFVQVLPTGRAAFGSSSNLNVERPGQTIANAAIASLGDGDGFSLFTQSGTHLLADTAGWFRA